MRLNKVHAKNQFSLFAWVLFVALSLLTYNASASAIPSQQDSCQTKMMPKKLVDAPNMAEFDIDLIDQVTASVSP